MFRAVLVLAILCFTGTAQAAPTCAVGTDLSTLTNAIDSNDKYEILDGDKLDLFVKNANDLWNIGWVRSEIDKIYVIEAVEKSNNPRAQVLHLFFIDKNECIAYYQTVYRAWVDLVLERVPGKEGKKPCEVLGTVCQ